MSTINIFHDIAIWKFFICRKMYISKFTFLCDVTEEVEFLAPWNKTRTLAKKNKKYGRLGNWYIKSTIY